jgi:hypothetical protein
LNFIDCSRSKRSVNGNPIPLFVEILVVADSSIYEDHKTFAGSTDPHTVLIQMRVYFAHLISGVNERFKNSLANDPDLKIMVVAKNFLFLRNQSDSQWSNPVYVGDSAAGVVFDQSALNSFNVFMNARRFPFAFDLAIGFFK